MPETPESRGGTTPQPNVPPRERARDARTGSDAAAARARHQGRWVELQVQEAIERGDFDDLPGKGKPLGDLGQPGDRDWWLRKLIEREQVTGVLPAALQLRKEDAELDTRLDRETSEKVVREHLEDFNRRVVEARRQLQGGPPVITAPREVDAEVQRWRERVRSRRRQSPPTAPPPARRRRWFTRNRRPG